MKRFIALGLILFCLLFVAACKKEKQEEAEPNNIDNVEEINDNQNIENHNEPNDEEEEEAEIDPHIVITAEVHVGKDKIVVEGKTNAPEGSRLDSRAEAGGWAVIPFMKNATVQQDGTFKFEFQPMNRDTEVQISLAKSSLTEEIYGDKFEEALGTNKRVTDDRDRFDIRLEFFLDGLKEKPYTMTVDVPEWDIPDDYGEQDIWMEVEYETTHRHIIFTGKSNLVEGSYLGGNLMTTGDQIEPFAFKRTNVLPDGSFTLRVPYHKLKKGLYMPIEFIPSKNSWDNPIDHYGEKGEKLLGDLVRTDDDGKYIRFDVPIEDPDFDVPDDVDLTMEEEEVKIQVPDDLLFDFDKSSLKADAKATLDQILSELEKLPEKTEIHINGHTDNEGSPEYNLTLSEERAESVFDYMRKNGKIDHINITLHGYGEERPIASNEESKGRAKNRRVEIVVNPN